MKDIKTYVFLILILGTTPFACGKKYASEHMRLVERKIVFQLWTDQDFSSDYSVINFSVFVRQGREVLFDSSLASMMIKDIPDAGHKITVEKKILVDRDATILTGFNYEIPGIGVAWHTDTMQAGSNAKTLDYAFK